MMLYDWNVYYDGEYIATVRAHSEQSACDRVYMQTGGASAYSGRSSNLYTAERM